MAGSNKRTILLVEDNVITAMEEQVSLEKYGYHVIPAYSGEEAVESFSKNSGIELILMDIDLGAGINGADAARSILKIREIPIVFLSSHTEPEIVETTEKITSYGYVVKNSGITVLDASIKMAFRLFDAKKQITSSELKQQAMISNIWDIIGITDRTGIVKYVSSNIRQRFGWDPSDITGTNSINRIHPDDIDTIKNVYHEIISERNLTRTMMFRYICKNGSYRHIEVSATNLIDEPLIDGILLNFHDVTERIKTEAALRKSESNYRQLYENAPTGIYRVDFKTGKFIQANDVFLGYLGYTMDEIKSISPFDILSENSKKIFIERLKIIKQGGDVSDTVDYEIIDKDGKNRHVHLMNKMVYDDEGHIVASDVVAYEITDRIRMENALKKSEADFKSILGHVPGMVYRCANDKDWTMKFISDGAFLLTGFYPHELINNSGRAYASLIHQDDRSYVWGVIQKALKCGGHWELEYRIVAKDNSVKWVYERGQVVAGETDGENFLEGYITDITRYKLTEGEIAKREEKYRRIFENIQDCYYEVTLQDNTIAEISPSIEFVSNGQYRREDVIGRHMSIFYSEMADRDVFLSLISERGSVTDYEILLRNRDGSIIPCSFSSKLLYDEDGRPERIIGIIRNITERKRFDENIAELLKEKELILKEVHHRIKNNMNTIYGLLSLQSETINASEAVDAIKDAASRVRSMMLLYDKLYRSYNVTELSVRLYLSSLVDEIIENFPNSSSVKVEKNIEDLMLGVKLLQPLGIIINELLTNIMKYAFPGGAAGEIKVLFSIDSGRAYAVIKDNGAGMPESVDFNNSRGFGLMLVQLLAKQLRGNVKIERGNGTSVMVDFPL